MKASIVLAAVAATAAPALGFVLPAAPVARASTACTTLNMRAAAPRLAAVQTLSSAISSRPSAIRQRLARLLAGQPGQGDEVEYYEEVESDNEDDAYLKAQTAILKQSSRQFQQYGWCSWWGQVIILFANAITERAVRGNVLGNGVFLAGLGVASSAASIFCLSVPYAA
eukprot:17853-Heterococcus_DN1.PRE.2